MGKFVKGDVVVVPFPFSDERKQETPCAGRRNAYRRRCNSVPDYQQDHQRQLCHSTYCGFQDRNSTLRQTATFALIASSLPTPISSFSVQVS